VARTLVDHADMLLRRGAAADYDQAARLLDRADDAPETLEMVALRRRAAGLRATARGSAALA
jgi:hypothetical protein